MASYVRPAVPGSVFLDGAGRPIVYGQRWPGHVPPDNSYSVVSNPERFRPLHRIADALIEYLRDRHAVDAYTGAALAGDLMHDPGNVVHAVRLAPRSAEASPLTFGYTGFPGLVLHAGLLHDFPFPDCGCDACDETADAAADDLEDLVFAVVEGRFSEGIGRGRMPWVRYQIRSADGSPQRSGGGAVSSLPRDRARAARRRLRALGGQWRAWPEREGRPYR